MRRCPPFVSLPWLPLVALLGLPGAAGAQERIEAVDLYGVRSIDGAAVHEALGIRPGDAFASDARTAAALTAARDRVESLPGVDAAQLSPVCCGAGGGMLLYVGIRETGTEPVAYRPAPTGAARLTEELLDAVRSLEAAVAAAVRAGTASEDISAGHSLLEDPTARAIQSSLVEKAAAELPLLRRVLLESADGEHRAAAATLIGYAPDKAANVDDLAAAATDPDASVRNNATRALMILASYASDHPQLGIRIEPEPFIRQLRSLDWTDRNKASMVLFQLSSDRNPALLERLRREALPELIEMARWTSPGHALPAIVLLGRVGGVSDERIFAALGSGDVDALIEAAAP